MFMVMGVMDIFAEEEGTGVVLEGDEAVSV